MAFNSFPIPTADSALNSAQGVAAIQKAHSIPSQAIIDESIVQSKLRNTMVSKIGDNTVENFDRANNTLVKDLTTNSGHNLDAGGAGAATARVIDGYMESDDNIYLGMLSTVLVTRVEGVLSLHNNTTSQGVIMFNGGPDSNSLEKLIHLECHATDTSMKFTSTGAANLTPPAQSPTERNNQSTTNKHLIPALFNKKFSLALEYYAGATALEDVIALFMPDGRILEWTNDARIRAIMATCYSGTWQSRDENQRWHQISTGLTRADSAAALGGSVDKTDLISRIDMTPTYKSTKTVTFTPTAVGWYKIIDGLVLGGAMSVLTGDLEVIGFDNAGRNTQFKSFVNIHKDDAPEYEYLSRGFGEYAGQYITKTRMSTDSNATGAKQMEVYVNKYTSPNDTITVRFTGAGTLFANPVVGSTPLSGISREQAVYNLKDGFKNEGSQSTKTFLPGLDKKNQFLVNSYASNVDFFIDNNIANESDEFYFVRAQGYSNSAVIKNLSDSSTIVTLSATETATLVFNSGKFQVINRGSLT
jgi:hypothetical protein